MKELREIQKTSKEVLDEIKTYIAVLRANGFLANTVQEVQDLIQNKWHIYVSRLNIEDALLLEEIEVDLVPKSLDDFFDSY